MIHVFLDDCRRPPAGFVLARTAEECLLLLEDGDVDMLSLDHDLGFDEANGTELVKQMVLRNVYPREIFLHTSSPFGRREMYELLYQHKPEHVKLHYGPMTPEALERARLAPDDARD